LTEQGLMMQDGRQYLAAVTLLVRDYDEAKAFYVGTLGFTLVEDTRITDEKRWILVAPPGSRETRILLAKAATPAQQARIGDQTGGRVFLFLHTDDFWRDYHAMRERGVAFRETPRHEPYGIVAVFEDLYGNRWDLIQLTGGSAPPRR
jgi:catechol 2,3-dioxygenase-like lactoylglutathione lyase family enzyme